MKNTLSTIAIIALIIIGALYFFHEDKWIGFYYPDYQDLTKNKQSVELTSLEECRAWVDTQVELYNPSGEGYDYECGKNCKFNDGFNSYVCKETVE